MDDAGRHPELDVVRELVGLEDDVGRPVAVQVDRPLHPANQRLMDSLGVEVRVVTATATLHPGRSGSKYFYNKGCRCDECRTDTMAIRRAQRARARAANSPAYQRELATSRALKERYRGTCEHCGAPTTGCDGPGKAGTVCAECAKVVYLLPRAIAKRGHGSTVTRMLDFIGDGERNYTEIGEALNLSAGHAANALHRLVGYGLLERTRRGWYRRTDG